jgi:hypothetical protein
MRYFRILLFIALSGSLVLSCKETLNVNADWKDITVVYGLLDQTDSMHYLKITKAFLGEGNALSFAKIADSSNYHDGLEVSIGEYYINAAKDSVLARTILCDTVTIHDKQKGDSIFYYPDQLMYYFTENIEHSKDSNFFYKLNILEPTTNKMIRSKSVLVDDKFSIEKPPDIPNFTVNYLPGYKTQLKWTSAKNGRRYQVALRLLYLETLISDPSKRDSTTIEWVIFSNRQTDNTQGGKTMEEYFSNDGFYGFLHANIPVNPLVTRAVRKIEYVFTVGSDDLNTYMEVTEPATTIVQERPNFSNIDNGIGLFASRTKRLVGPFRLGQETVDEIRVNALTKDLGF